MTIEIAFFLLIIAGALILFIFEVFPMDVTALTLLTVLLVTGYLDLTEAISGFSNQAVLTVAAMFILSQALVKTGFVEVLGDRLSSLGRRSWIGIAMFLLTTSIFSGFINNTAAVAIFIPLAVHLAQKFQISPSKLLIPLSFAGIYGGMITLIGSSTNLLVSAMVEDRGFAPLGMFEFAAMGLVFLVAGTGYNVWIVPRILPSRAAVSSLTRKYHMSPYLTEFEIAEGSPLIGSTCFDRGVNEKYDITILSIIRGDIRFETNIRNLGLNQGDILLARGTLENFVRFREEEKALLLTDTKMSQSELTSGESVIVEGLVPQGSELIGKSVKDVDFRNKFRAFVLAIRREGKTLREKIARIPLHFADALLIFVPKSRLDSLMASPDLALMHEHDIRIHKVKFWWLAIGVIPLIMMVAALGLTHILQAALIGTVVLLVLRGITIQEAYRSVNWSVIILIAAFVPVGIAVERSGTAALIGSSIAIFGNSFPMSLAPYAALSLLYLVAVGLTSVLSNNAAAIVLVPVSFAVAHELGVDPRPFVFALCFGASTAFMTPLGYQTNLMVYGPGQYRFSDFVRAGTPLNLIFWVLGTVFIPLFWPF